MADDGAEDNEDDDKDERIRWYEGDGVEDKGEEGGGVMLAIQIFTTRVAIGKDYVLTVHL